MPVASGAGRQASHVAEGTRVDAHAPIAFRSDRGPSCVAGRAGGAGYRPATRPIVEEALEAEGRDALGRAIKVTDLERRRMVAVRQELDHEYEAGNGLGQRPAAVDGRANFFSTSRT